MVAGSSHCMQCAPHPPTLARSGTFLSSFYIKRPLTLVEQVLPHKMSIACAQYFSDPVSIFFWYSRSLSVSASFMKARKVLMSLFTLVS